MLYKEIQLKLIQEYDYEEKRSGYIEKQDD